MAALGPYQVKGRYTPVKVSLGAGNTNTAFVVIQSVGSLAMCDQCIPNAVRQGRAALLTPKRLIQYQNVYMAHYTKCFCSVVVRHKKS